MPSDTLGLTVSTGVSFGLLAGIVSGVCYLVANGFSWPGPGVREGREQEARGLRGAAEGDDKCGVCGLEPGPLGDYGCHCKEFQRPMKFEEGRWFLKQVQKTLSFMPWSVSTSNLDQLGVDRPRRASSATGGGEARSIRDFMEQLSERLAGGPLDRTSIASMYNHPLYWAMFSRHHAALRDSLAALALALRSALTNLPQVRDGGVRVESETPSASGAHARLKRLVQRVIEEAMALPALAHYAQEQEPRSPAFDAHTYEDLLATAILNKVIERYQTESTGGRSAGASSGIHSASASPTPPPSSSNSPSSPHTPPLHDDEDDQSDSDWEHHGPESLSEIPRRVPFPEFGGDIIHSTENLHVQHNQAYDEVSGSDLQAADGSWEENWLFQKKKIKTLQSVPVPMLVPNSNSVYRAMIGDRDAEDTTDLSDNATDSEDEHEYKSDIQSAIQLKTVIGGKTSVNHLIDINNKSDARFDALLSNSNEEDDANENNTSKESIDSTMEIQEISADFNSSNSESVVVVGMNSGPLSKAEFTVGEIHRTPNKDTSTDDVDMVSTINSVALHKENSNSLSYHQCEGEYEEDVAVPVQRYADSLRRQHYPDGNNKDAKVNITNGDDSTKFESHGDKLIPGSIADRERKKWMNYVEMPNNPYSAEAIQKRLSAKNTSGIFDFITAPKRSEVKVEGDKSTTAIKENDENKVQSEEKPASPSPKILKDVLAEEVPQYKRYGRDYYINEAKRSAGARKRHTFSDTSSISSMNKSTSVENFDTNEFTSPGLLINKFNSMAVVRHGETISATKIQNSITTNCEGNINKEMISIENEDINEQSLFSARPIYVDDETDQRFEEILKSAKPEENIVLTNQVAEIPEILQKMHTEPSNGIDESFLSSSSLDDSIKIYNVPTGEIVKNPKDKKHLIANKSSTDVDKNDNIFISDKTVNEAASKLLNGKLDSKIPSVAQVDKMMPSESDIQKIIEDLNITLPKVKDLAKKFVVIEDNEERISQPTPRRRKFSNDYELDVVSKCEKNSSGKQLNYMHSLTARSISKEFREELKLSMAIPIKTPGGTNEIPEGIEEVTRESSRPSSPIPEPGTLKNKLAFFESLRS